MSGPIHVLPTATPNVELIEMLQDLLALAERGELRALAMAGVLRNQLVRTGFSAGDASAFEMLGAIEHVKQRFYAAQIAVPS